MDRDGRMDVETKSHLVTIVLIVVGGHGEKTFKPVRREVTMMIR